jgi:hypothetical protein
MTYLTQLENYPTGDCVRTVFACLLDKKDPIEVPNFMRDGDVHFNEHMQKWLDENGLVWVEVSMKDWSNHPTLPEGYCGISGKSPRGDYNHIVVGRVRHYEDGGIQYRAVDYVHDTSPFHKEGEYIIGEPLWIGFLTRKL